MKKFIILLALIMLMPYMASCNKAEGDGSDTSGAVTTEVQVEPNDFLLTSDAARLVFKIEGGYHSFIFEDGLVTKVLIIEEYATNEAAQSDYDANGAAKMKEYYYKNYKVKDNCVYYIASIDNPIVGIYYNKNMEKIVEQYAQYEQM